MVVEDVVDADFAVYGCADVAAVVPRPLAMQLVVADGAAVGIDLLTDVVDKRWHCFALQTHHD